LRVETNSLLARAKAVKAGGSGGAQACAPDSAGPEPCGCPTRV